MKAIIIFQNGLKTFLLYNIYHSSMSQLNIIELIENNPITKLSKTYNNKLLNKIQTNFTGKEQQLFISSFYCYLNYDKNIDFVIDLDNIWKWLGFKQKINAKMLLEKYFKQDIDYKNLATEDAIATLNEKIIKKDEKWGGQNKQTILLNIKCFKSLCLKAQTNKAAEIHEYYMKMEEVLYETLEEETSELKLQLEQKDNTIKSVKKDKQRAVEQATITQFPLNTECIYIGTIDNTNDKNEKLIKFGHTNNLGIRILDHRKKYTNFTLIEAFRVQNKVEIENLIKSYPKIKRQIRTIEVAGLAKTEIIAYDDTNFTISRLSKHIKDIIHSKTYSIDNFNSLLKQNEDLLNELRELKEYIAKQNHELNRIGVENHELKELTAKQQKSIELLTQEDNQAIDYNQEADKQVYKQDNQEAKDSPNNDIEDAAIKRFDEFITTCCIVRKDVEVDSSDILAQFRIWNKVKPKRETNERLNIYLKKRFMAARLQNQDKAQSVHGFIGVMLNPIVYKRHDMDDVTETFIFESCKFAPNSRIATHRLHEEFVRYKTKMGLDIKQTELFNIKTYMDGCPYTQKGTLYIQDENFTHEGYYGIALKTDAPNIRKTGCSTGKKVVKLDTTTSAVLNTWDTIVKAALHEKISASKMSRNIKNNVVHEGCCYKVQA